jgi:CheY-like chemotaxis protein
MKVLIIEDDKLTLSAVQHSIENMGHEVYTAVNGEEAIDHARKMEFDLLLCDIMMPGISGLSLVTVLRQVHLVFTPIIIMSTLSNRPLLDAAYKAGANDFLNKPFTNEELKEKIKKYEKKDV